MLLLSISPNYIGTAAGVFTAASLLPQLIKIIKEKEAENISFAMLFILFAGLSLWIWYGIMRDDWPIIITNAFSLLFNALIIFFSIRYKKEFATSG